MLLGTGITVLASILPARQGHPRAADRGGPRGLGAAAQSRFAAHSAKTGVGVLLASLAALAAGMFAGRERRRLMALLLGGGVLGLFMGIALLAPQPREAARPRGGLAGASRRRRRR